VKIEKGTFASEGGLRLPYLASPDSMPHPRWVLAISPSGSASAVEKWAKAGSAVTAVDLRGWGEMTPEGKSPFGADWKEAFLSLHLDRSLLGQRVQELLTVRMGTRSPGATLAASGEAGVVALHAAALDPSYTEVILEKCLVSWSAVAAAPVTQNALGSVVPGVLEAYDLPDLAALIAPVKLTIKAPVDGAGKPITQAELEAAWATARAVYKAAGAEANLVLEARP
jgi:hypothetical protein